MTASFDYGRGGWSAMRFRTLIGVLYLCGVAGALTAQTISGVSIVKSEFLFTKAPFAQCHASTLAETSSGLVAAWFGGTREGNPDVGIWVTRCEGGKWSPPIEVANGKQPDNSQLPCWNPVLFQPKAGPLMLFYKIGPKSRIWWGMMLTSFDSANSWSLPQRLPQGIIGPIKNKPVELNNGDLVCPTGKEENGPRILFEHTRDQGRTWKSTAIIPDGKEFSAMQPTILVHNAGRLQALVRTRQSKIVQTWSADGGFSWTKMQPTTLPNPNSGIDAVTLRDGLHLLVYNHTVKDRSPLNVAVSRDGQNWRMMAVLENEPGEFSYPAVFQTRDGLIHVTYTWKRRRIKHVVLQLTNAIL